MKSLIVCLVATVTVFGGEFKSDSKFNPSSRFQSGAQLQGETAKPPRDKTFHVVRKACTWEEAKVEAEKRGGRLAIVRDRLEQEYLAATVPSGRWWVGAKHDDRGWRWENGTPLWSVRWAEKGKENNAVWAAIGQDGLYGIRNGKKMPGFVMETDNG